MIEVGLTCQCDVHRFDDLMKPPGVLVQVYVRNRIRADSVGKAQWDPRWWCLECLDRIRRATPKPGGPE